jgi:hypothetical protein
VILPRFTIRSILIAVALVAAVLAATIEVERAPYFAITVYIFVPAIAIGLSQRLGFRGILVAVVPSWLLVFVVWVTVFLRADARLAALFIGIQAVAFAWRVLEVQARGSPLGSLELSALWSVLSMLCSLALAVFCIVGRFMISDLVPIRL